MLFNTFQFLFFFLFILATYYALPHHRRILLLLVGSLYFYACYKPLNIFLLAITLVVDYTAGRIIGRFESRAARIATVCASVTTNLGILFTFKYLGFFTRVINDALTSWSLPYRVNPEAWIIDAQNVILETLGFTYQVDSVDLSLPVGISFYTFQSMSYVLDAVRGSVKIERNPIVYFTYVSFFPQLVAGPIERAHHLLPQFREKHFFRFERMRAGLQMCLWGMFKKVVIADSFAAVVNTVYAEPENYGSLALFTATLFFAIQIYCDFSGYSDMAIGVAKMLGFDLMTNFRQPYLARSIADFWQRWHISLTTWFRDYVYIPLGGNRVGLVRWTFNVSVVFLLSGFWHGANWTFIIWGALHAFYFFISRLTVYPRMKMVTTLRLHWVPGLVPFLEWLTVMTLVLIGWVFFRAESVQEAWYVVTHMFDLRHVALSQLYNLGLPRFSMTLAFFWIPFLMAVDACLSSQPAWVKTLWSYRLFRHLCYLSLFFAIALFGVFEEIEFIYFAF